MKGSAGGASDSAPFAFSKPALGLDASARAGSGPDGVEAGEAPLTEEQRRKLEEEEKLNTRRVLASSIIGNTLEW